MLVKPALSVTVKLNIRLISGAIVVVVVVVKVGGSRGAINVGLGVLLPTRKTGVPDIWTHL